MIRPPAAFRGFVQQDHGGIAVFTALSLPTMMLAMALVVDVGVLRSVGTRLQIAADSSALAGAAVLPAAAEVEAEAIDFAAKNYPDVNGNAVLIVTDVVSGNWDGDVFISGTAPLNAVRTTTRRSNANANPVQALFSRMLGFETYQMSRAAVAHLTFLPPCTGGGLFAGGRVTSNSNNQYLEGFCQYGRDGVTINANNVFGPGSSIEMLNPQTDFIQGNNNDGVDEALSMESVDLALGWPQDVDSVLADLETADTDALETLSNALGQTITASEVVRLPSIDKKTVLSNNTLYVVDGSVNLGSSQTLTNVAIVARGDIDLGSNSVLERVIFASHQGVDLGSNNQIGAVDYCAVLSGGFNVHLFAKGDISTNSNNDLYGMRVAGQGDLDMNANFGTIGGFHAEVNGDITINSNIVLSGCAGGLESPYGPPSAPPIRKLALVQ